MNIGVLELRHDEFMTKVIKGLKGHKVTYIRLKDWKVPLSSSYRVIIDRLSYDNELLRELLKNYSLDGAYVINNPFSAGLSNKIMDSKLCVELGIPIPETRIFPITDHEIKDTVDEPDWEALKGEISFPVAFKPYNGYAREKVFFAKSLEELRNLYNALKEDKVMLVQKYVSPTVYRAFCINKKHVLIKKWDPPQTTDLSEISSIVEKIKKWTVLLNEALDFDLNSAEWSIDEKGEPFLIDAFNEVPLVVRKEFDEEQFRWIVDRFVECVEEKASGNERNKTIFGRLRG